MLVLVWTILFFLSGFLGLLVNYWYGLFLHQDRYTRAELLDIGSILKIEIQILIEPGRTAGNFLAFSLGSLFYWLFTLLGGLVTPDQLPIADFAEGSLANAFFQSVFILGLFHFIFPQLQDLAAGSIGSPLTRITSFQAPFLLGMSHSLVAMNLAVWGVYHTTYFLFALLNGILAFVYSFYRMRIYQKEDRPEESAGDSEESAPYRDDDFLENNDLDLSGLDEDLDV